LENNNHISQEEFEKFERYILGHMEEQERIAFENEIATDRILSQKLEDIKVILEGVEEAAFRNNLDEIHQELQKDSSEPTVPKKPIDKNVKLIPWKTFSIAASLFFMAGFFAWLLLFKSDPNERLFMAYYQADPGLVTAMSSEANYEFDRGMVDYKSGLYPEALQRWELLLEEKPDNDTLNYFVGSAHLAMKETKKAQYYLQKVMQLHEGRFSQDAYWYLALSYLSDGETELAKKTLEKSDHPDKEALLEALQSK
jgi:tetratricopeptide (TPR) repeat protein